MLEQPERERFERACDRAIQRLHERLYWVGAPSAQRDAIARLRVRGIGRRASVGDLASVICFNERSVEVREVPEDMLEPIAAALRSSGLGARVSPAQDGQSFSLDWPAFSAAQVAELEREAQLEARRARALIRGGRANALRALRAMGLAVKPEPEWSRAQCQGALARVDLALAPALEHLREIRCRRR